HRFEAVVEPRGAHPQLTREAVDSDRLVKLSMEAFNSPGHRGGGAAVSRNIAEPITLLSPPEPVDNFSGDKRREERRFGWTVQQPYQPHDRIQQAGVQRADVDGPHI